MPENEKVPLQDRFQMAHDLAEDLQSANEGLILAYRDIHLIEVYYAEHDARHEAAVAAGTENDCTPAKHEFWENLSADVIASSDTVMQATHRAVASRYMMNRKAAEWGQKFEFISMEDMEPHDGESMEDYVARVSEKIKQAIADEADLALLDPDATVSETSAPTDPHAEAIFDFLTRDLYQPETIEDPNDPDEQEGTETHE